MYSEIQNQVFTDSCPSPHDTTRVRKREPSEEAETPRKKMKVDCVTSIDHVKVMEADFTSGGKRKASFDANMSNQGCISPEPVLKSNKRKAEADMERDTKLRRCSHVTTSVVPKANLDLVEYKQRNRLIGTTSYNNVISWVKDLNEKRYEDGDFHLVFDDVSAEEEKIFQLSSSGNKSRRQFETKYVQLGPIGKGSFGCVYKGIRLADELPVAIKHVPRKAVGFKRVLCNGRDYKIITEVALMLKSAGVSGGVGQSSVVSLLEWYILDTELILIMERPLPSQDLFSYISTNGQLEEQEAKMIVKQLVDAATHIHSKGVFHRDLKLENILVETRSGEPKVKIIDFGCGTFVKDDAFRHFWGTRGYAPPEWLDENSYSAGPSTVWQLGIIFYCLLKGHGCFRTQDFIEGKVHVRPLSRDSRLLLFMCLAINTSDRASLEELQAFLHR